MTKNNLPLNSGIQIGNLASRSLVNDTSSEELCSNNNNSTAQEPEESSLNNIDKTQEPSVDDNFTRLSAQSADANSSSSAEPLRSTSAIQVADEPKTQDLVGDTAERQLEEDMSSGQPNLARRSLTPPGFAQRIRQVSDHEAKDGHSLGTEIMSTEAAAIARRAEPADERSLEAQPEPLMLPNRTEGQRVKFNDENLVSVQGDSSPPASVLKLNDKSPATQLVSNRREHSPSMPIIREVQNETDFDAVKPRRPSESLEKSAPSMSHHDDPEKSSQGTQDEMHSNPARPSLNSESVHSNSAATDDPIYSHDDQSQDTKVSPEIELRVEETDNSQQSNMRHHRLPNESSHYSLMRATRETARDEESPRFSNLQFISLSEVESDAEEGQAPVGPSSSKTIDFGLASNHPVQSSDPTLVSQSTGNRFSQTNSLVTNGSSSGNNQQGTPIATSTQGKGAVIFPCLDDGLSSEPDSGDEEVDDDDERAMDADVEADDDEEDDDVDEDVENTLNSLSRMAIQTSMFNSTSQQRQQRHTHRAVATSSRQSQRTDPLFGASSVSDQSAAGPLKLPGSAYYAANQEPGFDMKQSPSFPNQNGLWLGPTSQQPSGLVPRSSSSQPAFNNQRSNLASSIHCGENKDEGKFRCFFSPLAKARVARLVASPELWLTFFFEFLCIKILVKTLSSRLSSDTDNETDRLLGSQRSDQHKLAGTETNSNNTIDSQPISSPLKQNANSKEGKLIFLPLQL